MLRDNGEKSTREWLDSLDGSVSARVVKHLNRSFEKQSAYYRGRNARRNQPPGSSVKVSLIDGQHPNALRYQKPITHWNIYIDETGSVFDDTAQDLIESHQVGRVIALIVPSESELPPVHGFHAAGSSPEEVDQVLQQVLDARVGILGFSVQDDSVRQRYWIGHVLHLIRWTLLQLPVPTGGQQCRVEIFIEQRDSYGKDTDLTVVAQALESELSAIDPDRFAELALDMHFMAL